MRKKCDVCKKISVWDDGESYYCENHFPIDIKENVWNRKSKQIPVDEDVYNSKPKAPKNKKFHTSIGDLTVGRIYGDDDATGIVESPEQKTKRNPFLYK